MPLRKGIVGLVALAVALPSLLAAPTTDTGALLAAAARERESGAMERAAGLYARVLDIEPGNRLALYNAGIILENAGRDSLAASVWRRALEADAGDIFAWEHLVRALDRDELQATIETQRAVVQQHPEAAVPGLRLALALHAGERPWEAIPVLERLLLTEPASNIAFLFLKDSFRTREALVDYVADVGRRAAAEDASQSLQLLHIRLLLERGRVEQARALALATPWRETLAVDLLTRAGVVQPGEIQIRMAGGTTAADPPPADEPAVPPPAPPREPPATPPVSAIPSPPPPDFGPGNPRSAPFHLRRGSEAMQENRRAAALDALRRAIEAAPTRLQPRIDLALLLQAEGHPGEARMVLRGPVEPSPWDVYMQAWRAVRDEFFDPDHGGADIYRLRQRAEWRIRTLDDARREIGVLLDVLSDPYAYQFEPERFAGYILAPNTGRQGPQESRAEPWVTIPEDAPVAGGESNAPPETSPRARFMLRPEAAERLHRAREDAGAPGNAGNAASDPGTAGADGHAGAPDEAGSSRDSGGAGDAAPEGGSPTPLPELQGEEDPRGPPLPSMRGRSGVLPPPAGRRQAPPPEAREPQMRAARIEEGIGYIRLPSLNGIDVPEKLDRALEHLDGIEGLVLDLRGNGGGDGGIAAQVASRFIDPGLEVCTYLTRRGPTVLRAQGVAAHAQMSLAVIVDGGTASAAEILVSALRQQRQAPLFGSRTSGKGLGQRALLLPDGSGLSMTRVRLLGPDGRSWHGRGIEPDRPVEAIRQPGTGIIVADLPLEQAREFLAGRATED